MLAAVSSSLLNVRSMPTSSSTILGQLTKGMVIKGNGPFSNWLQINFNDTFGFVSAHYLKPVNDLSKLTGTVNTHRLNVRQSPSSSGKRLGIINIGASIKTTAILDGWLEVEFNNTTAYVAAQFVDLVYMSTGYFAKVRADRVNVRGAPYSNASLFGQITLNGQVWVEGQQQFWSQICFNGNTGYVASRFLTPIDNTNLDTQQKDPVVLADYQDDDGISSARLEQGLSRLTRLTPNTILTVTGSSEQRNAAATWNRWGALLTELSDKKQLDIACALAVLCVESSGKGFEQNNNDRMLIRFENHKFWKFWGKSNIQQYRQHFCYSSEKVWREHKWRRDLSGEWQSFHGHQISEWQVFEFARQLDEDAAILSISMGAPQIMGFHFERIGYQSKIEMFDAFAANIQSQINGLFDFFSPRMLQYLRDLAFENFAGMYNGKGHKKVYADKIQKHYMAFKKMMPNTP